MKRKSTMRKPTHQIRKGDTVYAHVRCGVGQPAIKMLNTGEVVRSASFLLDCDLLMGRWQAGVDYCFGRDGDHIPADAIIEPIA